MNGLICVPCRPDQARHLEFYQALLELETPPGWKIKLYPGFFPHDNRNLGVLDAQKAGAEWLFILEDDVLIPPDGLLRMLSHNRPIVSALHLAKENPWPPYLFQHHDDLDGNGESGLLGLDLTDQRGLCPVDATGLGAVLIHTDVFKAIPFPWFDVTTQCRTDDIYFSLQVRGTFPIVCDLDVQVGHIIKGSVWPRPHAGGWETGLVIDSNKSEIRVPAAKPSAQLDAWRRARAAAAATRE